MFVGSILVAFLLGWIVISLFQPRRPISIYETSTTSEISRKTAIEDPTDKISNPMNTSTSSTKSPEPKNSPSKTPTPSSTTQSSIPKVGRSLLTNVPQKSTKIDERCSATFRPVDCP